MSVKVCFHGYMSPLPNLVNVAEVSGNTVGQCLADFVKLYPGAKKRVFDENGKLREYFALFVNEDQISLEQIDRRIEDGHELHIVPLIDGG